MQNIRKICFRIYNNFEYWVLKIELLQQETQASWLAPRKIKIFKEWKMEPKVTDRVDAVSEAGASEMMREVNI